jgi:hypothetical protein
MILGVDDKKRHVTKCGYPDIPDGNYGASVQCNVKVNNGRGNDDLKINDSAFELIECPTKLTTEEFYKIQDGDKELRKKYYNEVTDYVQKKLGCDLVLCYHSQVRNAEKGKLISGNGVQGYAGSGPHCDESPVTGDEKALEFLSKMKEDKDLYGRYVCVNLWRNISDHPIENHHLAVLDERSTVKPDDYLPRDIDNPSFSTVQYFLNSRHADHHKWYYFPRMTKSEGILIKNCDSDFTNSGRICFHMAIDDPNAPSDAKVRESIEVRIMCFWKKENCKFDSMPKATACDENLTPNASN